MNLWLITIYLLISYENLCEIDEVSLLKNKIWAAGSEIKKTDKGYLYEIQIAVEKENSISPYVEYSFRDCYYLQLTDYRYAVLGFLMNYIISFRDSPNPDNLFLRFKYHWNLPVENDQHLEGYNRNKNIDFTYKQLKKNIENNCLTISDDEIESRVYHANLVFMDFVYVKLLKLNNFILIFDENKIIEKLKNERSFDLYYFENHVKCLENLESFVEYLNCFTLKIDKDSESNTKNENMKKSINFCNRLNDKFDNDARVVNIKSESKNNMKILFKKCIEHFDNELCNKNIMLLIGEKLNTDFYLNEIYRSIYEIIRKINDWYDLSKPEIKESIIKNMIKSFNKYLFDLQRISAKSFFKTKFFLEHFSPFLKKVKPLDDYIDLEKTICDYFNMATYIINLNRFFNDSDCIFGVIRPISIDTNDFKIVRGFEILIKKSVVLDKISATSDEKQDITLEIDIHYFQYESNIICIPYEVLEKLKIREIMLEFYYTKNDKFFKVIELLFVKDGNLFK